MFAAESPPSGIGAPLRAWLLARDWPRLAEHFRARPAQTAEELEARALTCMALLPGPPGAQQALPDLQRPCQLQPGNPLLVANLIQALIDAERPTQACALSTDAVRQAADFLPLLHKHAFALAAAARWDEAATACRQALRVAAARAVAAPEALAALSLELASRWWQPLAVGGVRLRLPTPVDHDFVATTLARRDFMARYHRYQGSDSVSVTRFIERAARRPSVSRRIDWLVCDRAGRPCGLAALADVDPVQRRAEWLLGLPEGPADPSFSLKAALALLELAFGRLRLRKLVSHVYGDNPQAQRNTLHLGFRAEGLLRAHLEVDGRALDLHVNGLLAEEFAAEARWSRLRRRWIGDGSTTRMDRGGIGDGDR